MRPWHLILAGVLFIVGAHPWHLRNRGASAVDPLWMIGIGLLFFLAAAILAVFD